MRFGLLLFSSTAVMLSVAAPRELHAQSHATAIQLPSGAYVVMLNNTDSVPPTMVGEYRLVFDTTGTYRMLRAGTEVVIGKYTVRSDTLLLVDTGGSLACQTTAVPATYLWKSTPDGLELVAVSDPCYDRRRLTLHPMVKAKPR